MFRIVQKSLPVTKYRPNVYVRPAVHFLLPLDSLEKPSQGSSSCGLSALLFAGGLLRGDLPLCLVARRCSDYPTRLWHIALGPDLGQLSWAQLWRPLKWLGWYLTCPCYPTWLVLAAKAQMAARDISSTRSSRKIVLRSKSGHCGRWSLGVAEQLLPPAIIIGPSQVAPGSLLQDVDRSVGSKHWSWWRSRTNEGQGKVHSYGLTVTKNDGKPYWWTALMG